ncbi:MAG: Ig-like domain-containing protein [Gemmatimonadales bacterium]
MRNNLFGRMASLVVACALAACSKGTEGPVATAIVVTPGGQLAFGSINRTRKLAAKVLDQHGDSMPGLKVTWSSAAITVATVDTTGLVTAKGNGTTNITATSGSVHLDVPCAVAQAAANITAFSGDAQSFTVGGALPAPLDVRVTDSLGSAVAGASVGFVVSLGGGGLSTATAVSNASGDATTTWTLGHTAGLQQVTASLGIFGVTFNATANAGAAASIAVNGGNNQTYATGAAVPVAPSAKVTDQFGNLVSGAQVVFSVGAASGSVSGATQSSNGSGIATVGAWTLGAAGTDTLIATLSVATATTKFLATAITPGVAANVTVVAGNNQTGLKGYALNVRPAVKVTDSNGLPVNNAAVTFAVTVGGGSVVNGSVNTGTNGIAQVGNWIVGGAPGADTLSATVTGSGITGNPVNFAATGASPTFNITIQNIGPPFSAGAQSALDSAVAKWQRIIYQDIPDISGFSAPAGQCGPSPAIGPVTVDDILILVKIDSIDGPGKILGQSGPCYIRTTGFQTIMGIIFLDSADVATLIINNQLRDVITHEMGHTLGYGTLWGSSFGYNCLQNPSSPGSNVDTYFSCPTARAMFDSIGGTSYTGGNKVPVENCVGIGGCGAGTYNSHWRESTFFNELMTGYINSGVNPLSVLTIASMADEGYTVNFAAADAYTRTFSVAAPLLRAPAPGQQLDMGDDILHVPIHVVDRSGRVVRVIAPQ